jgi:hypothetical protein
MQADAEMRLQLVVRTQPQTATTIRAQNNAATEEQQKEAAKASSSLWLPHFTLWGCQVSCRVSFSRGHELNY